MPCVLGDNTSGVGLESRGYVYLHRRTVRLDVTVAQRAGGSFQRDGRTMFHPAVGGLLRCHGDDLPAQKFMPSAWLEQGPIDEGLDRHGL